MHTLASMSRALSNAGIFRHFSTLSDTRIQRSNLLLWGAATGNGSRNGNGVMQQCEAHAANPRVVAVSISAGGIPKHPMLAGLLAKVGFVGDGHCHAKHVREDRAVSLLDHEILQRLVQKGFPLVPGAVGENLTVVGLSVQQMPPGTLLQIGSAILQLERPRKPCTSWTLLIRF
jgi:hypothetical protein